MKIEIAFLRSKVARRIFTLFIISSLIPVVLLMLLAFRQVNNLISTQQHEQLKQTNKQYGITVFERLLLLKKQINWIAQSFTQEDLSARLIEDHQFSLRMSQDFKKMGLIDNANQSTFPLRNIAKIATLIQTEQDYLKAGNSILISDYQPHFSSRIFFTSDA
jgi:hypothetical protein